MKLHFREIVPSDIDGTEQVASFTLLASGTNSTCASTVLSREFIQWLIVFILD